MQLRKRTMLRADKCAQELCHNLLCRARLRRHERPALTPPCSLLGDVLIFCNGGHHSAPYHGADRRLAAYDSRRGGPREVARTPYPRDPEYSGPGDTADCRGMPPTR